MSTTIRLLVALSLATVGCHAFDAPYMDPKVASQVTVTKSEPPPGCVLVGLVKGSTIVGDLSEAHGDVLRNAVLRGGNFVSVDLVERPVLMGVGGGYTVRGRLYACPSLSPSPTPTAAAPLTTTPTVPDAHALKACDPECASGFTCQLGACMAAPPPHAGN